MHIEEDSRKCNQHAGNGHGFAKLNAQVFVHQLYNNVQTAGRCIAGKYQRQTDTNNQNIADCIQKLTLGNRLKIREDNLKNTHDNRI